MTDKKNDDRGAWVDSRTGKVVYSKPEEGRQLAAPGRPIRKSEQAAIEAAETAYETAKDDGKVETAAEASSKAAPAKKAAPKG